MYSSYYPGTCLEELRKTIINSVRIAFVSAWIQTENLHNVSLDRTCTSLHVCHEPASTGIHGWFLHEAA
jgi:hypothetical protein